ncbi:hypothetical protein [Methanobrevibacter sp.]|uniref:hypothetical protein n=1 Tax=Methanobrevibacter sp. TaxID=66852 RepID=UPI00388D55C6
MSNSTEEIMLTLGMTDNASSTAESVASNIQSAFSKLNSGLMNLGQVSDNVMQSLTGKSAMDNIFATASKAETNNVLLENMLDDAGKNFDSFYKKVDETTDNSIVSMQELIPALKAFKSATGATDQEMTNVTDSIANFGASVLAQTGSTDLAQQSMMDLSKGVKGAFASLDQYGISEDALRRTGYWNGDEKDVEGFMKAVDEVTGSTEKLMETNQGLDALIGKSFSKAGKKIGNEFLPFIKDIKSGFIELDKSTGGAIAATMLLGSAGIETGNRIMWNVSTAAQGVRDLSDAFKVATKYIKGAGDAAEAAGDAINTMSNVSDIGAGVAGVGGAVGAGADVAKTAGKGEKAIEGGMDALLIRDVLKGNSKDYKKLKKEAEGLYKERGEIMEKIHNFDGSKDSKKFKRLQQQLSKNDREITKGLEGLNPLDLLRDTKTKKVLSPSESAELFGSLESTMDIFEKENMTLSKSIKGKLGGFKSNIAGAFSTIRNFNIGETLQNGLMKGFSGIGNIASTIKGKFTSIGSSLAGLKDIDISGKLKSGIGSLDKKLYQSISGLRGTAKVMEEADAIGDTLKGADKLAEGMSAAAAAGDAATAAGPAMEAGAAGAEAASVGATGLSAAFTSMIVPLLALSATIIIMIPIAALIAAEAMIFLKLLGEFMEALSFDSINLDGATKGISQIATALAWVGAAMLALTAVNITTQIAMVTSMFMGMTGPLERAVDALKKAGELLKSFNSVGIDPSVATNLQTISSSLSSVSTAMMALTSTNITVGFSDFIAWALGFGSVTDGLEKAKNDILAAGAKLNEFSGMTPLDDKVAKNIQNVCDSLASVGNAMEALRSIRDGQNWDNLFGGLMKGLFGEGVDIQTALLAVKEDIIDASQALAEFTGISDIPEDVSSKIQKVGDTLKTVSESVTNIKELVGSGFDNWVEGLFGGYDVAGGLEKIKNDLISASEKLAELSGLDTIDEGITEKIQQVSNALTKVSEVSGTLVNLGGSGIGEFDSTIISTAVTNVQTAATELAKLNEITFDGATADTILGAIQTTLENVKTTLSSASGFSESATSIGSQIVSGVQTGLSPLAGTVQGSVSSAINSAGSNALSGGAMLGRAATTGFKSSLKLADVMTAEMGYVKTAVDNGISAAKAAAESGAKEVVEAFKSGVNVGSPGDIARTIKQEMEYTHGFILASISPLYRASYDAAKSVVGGFGNPSLDVNMFTNGGQLTAEHIEALKTTISNAPEKMDNRPVTIIVSEGAVNVDARNYTKKEAQGLMITALEGMDHITDVTVDGNGE